MARFGRVLTAMVTPFNDDGSLNLDVAQQLARYLQDHGNDGLVVAGTTGEAPVLTDDERLALFAAVIEAVTIPVIAGSGTNDTAHSVHLTKEAAALGAAGILAVCPYYNRPSMAGIDGHMRAMAGASDLPVMVYDIPVRTGRKITTAALLKMFREVPNIVALKDAAGNPGETASLISMAPDGVEVYSGDDSCTLPLLARRRSPTDVRPVGQGRHHWRSHREQSHARQLRVRDRRRCAQPHSVEGNDASPRHPCRPGPPADGRCACIRRATCLAGVVRPATMEE
jgi:dihydrodipicolinate synthase/N-acetylneuraminate lyase